MDTKRDTSEADSAILADPELARLVKLWGTIPAGIRSALLALAESAKE